MRRLIERGLMFGNLVHVTSPVLIARYNRAMEQLTGRTTALQDFHIDISGFSPEVGAELDDPLYLNPRGVNRQFILLTPDQKYAPLLDAKFSFTRDILRSFIVENEPQLFALTTRDAVGGELLNSVFDVSDPHNLLDIRRVEVEADTAGGTLQKADALAGKVSTFLGKDGAWHDDVLIAEMIALAQDTGDLTRHPVQLAKPVTPIDHFWTAHFGGLYLFRFGEEITVIAHDPTAVMGLDGITLIDLADRVAIAAFLHEHQLAEPLLTAKGVDGAQIVARKMDYIAAHVAADAGADHISNRSTDLRRLARKHAEILPPAYSGLADLHRWATAKGRWPRIASDHAAYFYSLRATQAGPVGLINRLLAAMTPLDLRQLFICHKELFYKAYANWPDVMKDFTARVLEDEYLNNKVAARDALFATDVDEEIEAPDMVAAVGPWGAVRRAR